MRFLKSYGLALLFVVGIAGWMVTGTLIEGGRGAGEGEQPLVDAVDGDDGPLRGFLEAIGLVSPETEPETVASAQIEDPEDEVQRVRVETFSAEDLPEVVRMRGRTEANAVVAARAEIGGVVKEVLVSKGDTVAEGDLLCRLDQGTRQARVASAEAQLEQARADLENNTALRERGVAPANTGRQFEVALLSAQASYDEALAELERTEIHAEAAGIVEAPLATVGSSLSAGTECATIIQLDPMVFIGSVPEARVGLLQPGEQAVVSTVTGEEVQGAVRYVAATANESTRTFTVEIEIPNPEATIRNGVTAEALVEVGSERAHLVPQSVLTLDVDGRMGVRTVEDNVVAFHPVEIVRDTRDGAWVTGLPETAHVITLGQEYVETGQTVSASRSDEA